MAAGACRKSAGWPSPSRTARRPQTTREGVSCCLNDARVGDRFPTGRNAASATRAPGVFLRRDVEPFAVTRDSLRVFVDCDLAGALTEIARVYAIGPGTREYRTA